MARMRLIDNSQKLKSNVDVLYKGLTKNGGKDYDYAVNLVKQGRNFIVYAKNDKLHFAPSRFVGYANNTFRKHQNHRTKNGSETSPKVSSVMHTGWLGNVKLDLLHKSFCESIGSCGTLHRKTYIFLDGEAERLFNNDGKPTKRKTNKGRGKGGSPKDRAKVEAKAVEVVTEHYEERGFTVKSVERDNVGWDLNVKKADLPPLKVEVKGLSGNEVTIELTPNEYKKSSIKNYRICVVTKALAKQKLYIFKNADGKWCDDEGNELVLKELVAARGSLS